MPISKGFLSQLLSHRSHWSPSSSLHVFELLFALRLLCSLQKSQLSDYLLATPSQIIFNFRGRSMAEIF